MPVLGIPKSGMSLGGSQTSAKPGGVHPEVFSLSLSDSVIEDMIKCVRSGKSIELSLGNDPKIIYDSQAQPLSSTEDPFYTEYYRTPLGNSRTASTNSSYKLSAADMPPTSFWAVGAKKGFVPQIRTVPRSALGRNPTAKTVSSPKATDPASNLASKSVASEHSPTASTDAALEALKTSLASEDARKRGNTTKQVKNTAALPPAIQQRGSAKPSNKNRFLAQNKKSLGSNTTRSMPTSPSLTGANSPSLAPTSAPLSQQQADKTRAIRRPIIHRLAVGPTTEDVIRKYQQDGTTNTEFKTGLEKVADFESGKWTLKQRSFRDLDVFGYEEYTREERQTAIENAVRAYDKLRLGASEPEWERLLPEEERGTGKILSKLQAKIATGAIKPAKAPKIKLTGAGESGRDTGTEDNDEGDLFGDKVSAAPQSAEMARSHSNPPLTKTKKVSEKEAQAKRLLTKSGKVQNGRIAKSAAAKPEKKSQEKSFKSSKFVNDSDEEDDYLVNNPTPPASAATATATTAKKNVDRKPLPKSVTKPAREEPDAKPSSMNNKPKGNNTSPMKSSPLVTTPPTNASDIEDSSSSSVPTTLKRKADSQSSSSTTSSLPLAKRHQKSGSSSSSSDNSSVTSSNGIGSGSRRSIGKDWAERTKIHQLTQKYNAYYPKYRQLYREMEIEDGPRDPEKMADLFEMQQRLQNWKKEILKGHDLGV